jgi:hypothetical protein
MTTCKGKILLFFLLPLFFACSSKNTNYRAGFFLNEVSGEIILNPSSEEDLKNCLLVVISSRSIGITLEEPLYKKQAYIVKIYPSGRYSFSTLGKGQIFELSFFCSNFKTKTARFSQTLGIGKIIYSPTLQKDRQWKNSYSFVVRPFLENILTEPKYLLSNSDSLFLSDWLEEVERNLF